MMKIPTTVTRSAVAQFEALRLMGTINMFHYEGVQREAIHYHLKALRALSQSEYYFIFRNAPQLLAHYQLEGYRDPEELVVLE